MKAEAAEVSPVIYVSLKALKKGPTAERCQTLHFKSFPLRGPANEITGPGSYASFLLGRTYGPLFFPGEKRGCKDTLQR